MTASTARTTGGRRDAVVGRLRFRSSLQGLPDMVLFIARRNWLRLLVWAVVLVGMIPLVYESQRAAFPTSADREAYASIANTPSVAALTGTAYAANTLGGILVLKIWMTLAITLAFATVFLVTRNGRADEEDGRTELLRANVLGRHSYTLANYFVVAAFNVVVGVGIAGTAMVLTLPVMGSLVLGASLAGVGLFFLGVAAIGSQISTTSRGANSFAAAVIGVAYVVRAIGDLNGTVTTPGWISWLSPIGWGQQMRAFGVNRWGPLALLVVGAVLLCWIALKVEARRDLGSGVLPNRPGPPVSGRFLQTTFGLAIRLQRGTILGWLASVVVMALLYGSVASAMVDLLGTNPVFSKVFAGQGQSITNSVLGLLVMLNAIVASAFVVESTLQLRVEEASGRAEPQLAGSVSRLRWASGRLLVPVLGSALMLLLGGAVMGAAYGVSQSDSSQLWVLLGASIAYWPGVLLTAGVAVVFFASIPRQALALSWAYFSILVIISVFGELFSLPSQIINNTPLTATPRLPSETLSALPLLVLAGIALLLWAIGLLRFARRDLIQGA
ncbi:ABC transporter permease [Specibacter sp. NPDC078692]|uniref:ABC transporter permease n=1 Tax=Specibacter sp. NPDC078692 TaxID=3155818 RepID=UPI0034423068